MDTPTPPAKKEVSWFSFWSLTVIQSMNSLNEKGVQFLLVALSIWMSYQLQYVLSVLIVLPFVLFAPFAGWLSDRFCKTRILQSMVFLQIVILVGMSVGLFLHQVSIAIGFFVVFCVQAMIFSPAKKGLVKDIVGTENLGFASGILEISSMLALLVGQIGALFLVYHLLSIWGNDHGWEAAAWPCLFCCIGAICVFILSLKLPRFEPLSKRPFQSSIWFEHTKQLSMLWHNRVLRHSQVGIGYFWFVGGTMVLIIIEMALEANPVTAETGNFMSVLGQQKDSALLMAWVSGGSVLGGIVTALICLRHLSLKISLIGGLLLTFACSMLYFLPFGSPFFFVSLGICGMTATGFLVPLNAILQDRADNDKRGDVLAASNLVDCTLGIAAVLLQGGMKYIGLSTSLQCGLLACSSLAVTYYLFHYRHEIENDQK